MSGKVNTLLLVIVILLLMYLAGRPRIGRYQPAGEARTGVPYALDSATGKGCIPNSKKVSDGGEDYSRAEDYSGAAAMPLCEDLGLFSRLFSSDK